MLPIFSITLKTLKTIIVFINNAIKRLLATRQFPVTVFDHWMTRLEMDYKHLEKNVLPSCVGNIVKSQLWLVLPLKQIQVLSFALALILTYMQLLPEM